MFAILSALLLAQTAPTSAIDDRMNLCLQSARTDPATAIAQASEWLLEPGYSGASAAQQCLGTAYTRLLKWEASEEAFIRARDAAPEGQHMRRAMLGTMAANAALAAGRTEAALGLLDAALLESGLAAMPEMSGAISVDRARALVNLGRPEDAAKALEGARVDAPQNSEAWLLSATLARRTGDLTAAQSYIEIASALAPTDPDTGLEAGVIAVLSGREDSARKSWMSVVAAAPGTPQASTAQAYLDQIVSPTSVVEPMPASTEPSDPAANANGNQ